ncbi:MAG TPA: FecR domain-containing protein [Lacipirellulaceae bacterium]|nr:FecR domain-containing protein [Lacipirellulaceae bacterium]
MNNPQPPVDFAKLQRLIAERCNGTLSPEQTHELEAALAASAEAREYYWEYVSIHAALRWTYAGKRQCDTRLALLDQDLEPLTRTPGEAQPVHRRWSFHWQFVAAATILAATTALLWTAARQSSLDAPADVASLSSQTLGSIGALSPGTRWSFGKPVKNHGECRIGDTLRLTEGAAELRMSNGVVAQLEAPLIVDFLASDRARLLRGRLTMDVPSEMKGFAVETSAAEVIDLGTTFSVDVSDHGDTDVVVFLGQVDVNPAPQADVETRTQRLFRGDALRVTEDGTLSRIVNVRRAVFDAMPAQPPVITEVRDNVARGVTHRFYEIVAGGMQEDAPAFVDRNHEWNGLRPEGLPAYLVGGDYVRTFNDDKVNEELELKVVLDRPARLYLLVDDRLQQTDWLLDQFFDTGDDVGVDEGVNFEGDPRRLAIGPGDSIDQIHSVWASRETLHGVVNIGPFPVSAKDSDRGIKAKLNMFGIVAVAVMPEHEL